MTVHTIINTNFLISDVKDWFSERFKSEKPFLEHHYQNESAFDYSEDDWGFTIKDTNDMVTVVFLFRYEYDAILFKLSL